MKKYLADLLTVIRLFLAIALFVLTFTSDNLAVGFTIFILGELTDAFDGTFAMKWPFPKNKIPKYRKYASKYDMIIDALLALSMMFFFTVHVTLLGGLIMGITYILAAITTDLIVYGKVMGHPDDCRPHSLIKRNFRLAKKIILARRMIYLSLIVIAATWTLYASAWPLVVKFIVTVIAITLAIFLWFFQAQRRHHISRDAVDIEKQLSKN